MPSYNNTVMLFVSATRPETPTHPSQEHQAGGLLCPRSGLGWWDKECLLEGGYLGGMGLVGESSSSLQYTMKPEAYDANEVVGAKREKQHEGKTNTKEEWEGRSSPKAAEHWGPFHITAAVGVNQVVSINNVRPVQAGLMSSSLSQPPPLALPKLPTFHKPLVTTWIWLVTARHPVICQFARMSKSQTRVNYAHKVGIGWKKYKRSATQGRIMEMTGETAGWNRFEWRLFSQCFCLLHSEHLTQDF